MKNIKLLVLDMAGTTVKEDNLVYKTVQKVINDEGFNISLDEVLRYGAGKEKHKAITDVLKACTTSDKIPEIADRAFEKFKEALFDAYNTTTVSTYNGIEEFFTLMRENDIKIVLNTGYNRQIASKIMNILQWQVGNQIDGLITDDDVQNGRPHPDMIKLAMSMFNIEDASVVLKAGDSAIDIIEGKNAGCGITIGVLSGAQTREQLQEAKPDYILNDVTEIGKLLLNI